MTRYDPIFAVALAGVLLATACPSTFGQSEAEPLTRGPVHEGFAAPVVFNPQAGPTVSKEPPPPVEEIPPTHRPDGSNVVWIGGYWGWDEETSDFIWLSGVWRDVPPGHEFVPGYWNAVEGGWQWVSGYWKDATTREVQYLATPPATLERGPVGTQPTESHIWVSGCWVWHQERYMWRPGHWLVGRPDWIWIPAHYVWTPAGCVYVAGYWDYVPTRRGVIFAPYRIAPATYARASFRLSPSVVIDAGVAFEHGFVSPRHRHYCFGDYYTTTSVSYGVVPGFSFHYTRVGYDPAFVSIVYTNRRKNRDFERHWRDRYDRRYKDQRERPPRTWVQQQTVINNVTNVHVTGDNNNVVVDNRVVGRSLETAAKDPKTRMKPVDEDGRRKAAERSRSTREYVESRRRREAHTGARPAEGRGRPTPDATAPSTPPRGVREAPARRPDPVAPPKKDARPKAAEEKRQPPRTQGAEPPKDARPGRTGEPVKGTPPARGVVPEKGVAPEKGVVPGKGVVPEKGVTPEKGVAPGKGVGPKGEAAPSPHPVRVPMPASPIRGRREAAPPTPPRPVTPAPDPSVKPPAPPVRPKKKADKPPKPQPTPPGKVDG